MVFITLLQLPLVGVCGSWRVVALLGDEPFYIWDWISTPYTLNHLVGDNYNAPPYLFLDNDWWCVTVFSSWLAHPQKRKWRPTVFDGLGLYKSPAVDLPPITPSTTIYNSWEIWAKSYDVSWPYRAPLNWPLCLESEGGCSLLHSSKPVRKSVFVSSCGRRWKSTR